MVKAAPVKSGGKAVAATGLGDKLYQLGQSGPLFQFDPLGRAWVQTKATKYDYQALANKPVAELNFHDEVRLKQGLRLLLSRCR